MWYSSPSSAIRALWIVSLVAVAQILSTSTTLAVPNYVANLTNTSGPVSDSNPVILTSSLDQSEGRHAEGFASSGAVLAGSLLTSKGVSGFNNGIFTDYSANLAATYDDIFIAGPATTSIPITLHVPFHATFTQSYDSLTLTGPGGFTDISSIGHSAELFSRLVSPSFGITSGRFTLSLNDQNDTATIGITPLNNGIPTPAAIQAGASPGPPSTETHGLITIFHNIPLDANGFLYLDRIQTPITAPSGIFGPGVGFHFDDFVSLNGEMLLPGIAQVGVPLTLDASLSIRSIAAGGFEVESSGGIDAQHTFGVPQGGVPVFELPPGYTANSVSLGIVDNVVPVPEPSAALLLASLGPLLLMHRHYGLRSASRQT